MELFRATILKGQNTCMDSLGNIHQINGLVIIKADGRHIFYDKEDTFFRSVCAVKTSHDALLLKSGKVNIY